MGSRRSDVIFRKSDIHRSERLPTLTGLDVLAADGFSELRGHQVAVLCNHASVDRSLTHIIDLLYHAQDPSGFRLKAVFGPQHGLFGHTQDNMIEWEGARDARLDVPVYSLYGESRQPRPEQLEGVDLFLVDLQDVGARYYTFIWTMALAMAACEKAQIPMLVLDRPNPIGGLQVEGPVLDSQWSSFVGLHPLPVRHGMTVAEVANHLQSRYYPKLQAKVVQIQGWSRSDYFDDLDLTWIPPSPNVPVVDTAVVYPGMCLLEATNLSEGRGTTRPFENFGAPWLDGWQIRDELDKMGLPGVHFRPVQFEPTFNKYKGERCGGCFIHVKDRRSFEPVLTAVAILRTCARLSGDRFRWKEPPYEYETEKRPIDILLGSGDLAEAILSEEPINELHQRFVREAGEFEPERRRALLYP